LNDTESVGILYPGLLKNARYGSAKRNISILNCAIQTEEFRRIAIMLIRDFVLNRRPGFTPLLALLLLSGLNLINVSQVRADETITVTGGDGTKTVVTTTTTQQPGSTVVISSIKPELFVTTLDGRIQDIQRVIASGQASGAISEDRAHVFRQELDRLSALEAQGRAGQMTYVQALPIAIELDQLSDRIAVITPGQTLTPLVSSNRLVLTTGQLVQLDDVMVRRAGLEGKIAQQLAAGKLTPDEAASLRQQMDDIARTEAQMRASNGGELSLRDGRTLYGQFDKVGSRLDRYIAKR
jgi:hypothetical protein